MVFKHEKSPYSLYFDIHYTLDVNFTVRKRQCSESFLSGICFLIEMRNINRSIHTQHREPDSLQLHEIKLDVLHLHYWYASYYDDSY